MTEPAEGRIPVVFVVPFYALLAAAAWFFLRLIDPGLSRNLWSPDDLRLSLGLAAGAAVVLLAFRWVSLRNFAFARALEAEFGQVLGRQRKWECILIALASGIAEEYFFRGWLQTALGLWPAALVFAALHCPYNRRTLAWPVLAFAAGAAFGWITQWTGNLVGAAAAHAVYNAVALWRITDRFGGGTEPLP
ncbi:MAG: CPBP family glutamic-type intramembrane protease [Planctomycetota bacterium]